MAIDKAVDSTALDSGLTGIADAIRAAGGTSADLTFPTGFANAINALETLQFVKTYEVSEDWTTDAKGNTSTIVSTVMSGYTRAANELYLFRVRNNSYTGEYACIAIIIFGNSSSGAVARKSGIRGAGATASSYIAQGAYIDVYKATAYPV